SDTSHSSATAGMYSEGLSVLRLIKPSQIIDINQVDCGEPPPPKAGVRWFTGRFACRSVVVVGSVPSGPVPPLSWLPLSPQPAALTAATPKGIARNDRLGSANVLVIGLPLRRTACPADPVRTPPRRGVRAANVQAWQQQCNSCATARNPGGSSS